MAKTEQQLNFLLPISNSRGRTSETKTSKIALASAAVVSEKRYIKIKESLKNKGLIKSR